MTFFRTTHDNTSNHNDLPPARLEAFSDGVMAIIITITVLELKVPTGVNFHDLQPLIPLFIAYAISFQTIGTYWNNHHHLLRATKHVSAGIMWANINLLFWLSLIPFGTGWLGANHGGTAPTVVYAAILLLSALSYTVLQSLVVNHSDNREELIAELNKSRKGFISLICYILAVIAGFYVPVVSDVLILIVSLMWFIPDKRVEKHL
ncbi:MAG TPA: TMEM175 family protein [Candidatus Andersenbacteria bacterium]|nr:TMEM175 family protein [Candidatus Andersenbacteria bacterium]